MSNISAIGMDISKRVFEVCGGSGRGEVFLRKRLYRGEVLSFYANLNPCRVFIESCGGSHYWARQLMGLGHEVYLISPQFVKPYVKSNKNDRVDAAAILEAGLRPGMRFVEVKSVEQQDIQHLHRVRSRAQANLTAVTNELHGILLEYGVVMPRGAKGIAGLPVQLLNCELGDFSAEIIEELRAEALRLQQRVAVLTKKIELIAKSHPVCKRLQTIPGVGPVVSTAMLAALPNPQAFRNGREFAASLGLVPRHTGTGGRVRLLGISKRGDCYLRKQLIHGARSVLYRSAKRKDKLGRWAENLKQRRGWNRASVALANKNARTIWALLRYEKDYSPIAA